MSNVTQRYLNIGIGQNDIELTKHYFEQSLTINIAFSFFILLIAETIGFWFVYNKLNIPENRHFAAMCVYHFSILSVICSINQTTFLGAIVAHEKMNIYAYVGLFEGIARLLVIFLLQLCNVDHLILYGAMMALISVICTFVYMSFTKQFEEYHLKICWDRSLVKEMGKFVGCNLFGCFAYSAGMQGTNVVMNLFFGPVVNAARGIALQVSSVAIRFTESIMTSIKPQVIKSYAANDLPYMKILVKKGSKASLLLALLISIPILFKTDYILYLWLGNVPKYAADFAQLAIIESVIGALINPLIVVSNATGKIINTQVYGRLITLSSVLLSYLILRLCPKPIIPMYILVVVQLGYWLYCLNDSYKQINLNIKSYIKDICGPSLALIIAMLVLSFIIKNIFTGNSFGDFEKERHELPDCCEKSFHAATSR